MNGASMTRVGKSSQAVGFPWYLPINHILVSSQLADQSSTEAEPQQFQQAEQKGVGHTPTRAEGSGPYPVLPRSLGRKWGSTQGPDWRGGAMALSSLSPRLESVSLLTQITDQIPRK